MRNQSRFFFLLLVLALQFTASPTFAQYTKLYDFGGKGDGTGPHGTPVTDGTFLYGTTTDGGANDVGVIYKIKKDGSGFTKLYDFDGPTGAGPTGDLLYDGTFLYGTTSHGGANLAGAIYKIKADGTGYTLLFSFLYIPTGAFPIGSLITDGTFLYGMTDQGGSNFLGTVFKIGKDGTGHTKLVEFTSGANGNKPQGSLVSDGTFLYGMTNEGGASNLGTVFKVKTDGTGFAKLMDFTGTATGANPYGSLFYDGTFLHGMTQRGGSNNSGAIFKITTDGTTFVKTFDFIGTSTGTFPRGSFVSDGTFLYGTTTQGGANSYGTVFKIKPDGSVFTKLLDINGDTNGPLPEGTLLLDGTVLYGVRSAYGGGRYGGLFKLNNDGSGNTILYTFKKDASNPVGRPVSDGTSFYGLTVLGGVNDDGTIFKINPDGTGYTTIFEFDQAVTGGRPAGSLAFDGTFFYGMTSQGGANDQGVIFKIKPNGTGFVKLMDFDDAVSGSFPGGSFISDGAFLYGMTAHGGANGYGVLFKIHLDGTNFTKLLDFDYLANGAYPEGTLIYDGTFLYGLTYQGGTGGSGGWGTAFKIKTDGSGFVKLHDFDNPFGSNPRAALTAIGTTLYGMTYSGGANGDGTIFKVNKDGTGFTTLLDFKQDDSGVGPQGSLISVGSYLYGMTSSGGEVGNGTLFRIKPDGTGFSKYLDFNDGNQAFGSLASDGTFLYGTTNAGGDNGLGIFFKVTIAPFVTLTSFEPDHGVNGTYVTLRGHNFDPVLANNAVTFDGEPATVISGTTDSLVVVVPLTASDGPVGVTVAGLTDTSVNDFIIDDEAIMFRGKVKYCGVTFVEGNNTDDYIETFLPETPGDKVKVTFNAFDVDDILNIYDGPDTSYALLASTADIHAGDEFVATSAGGELTFLYVWLDAHANWTAQISCVAPVAAITIDTQPLPKIVCNGTNATFTTLASGTTNLSYQWQFSTDGVAAFADIANGVGYSNTATATLTVNTTGNFGAGVYRCRVNGDLTAEEQTNNASLTVNAIPAAPVASTAAAVCGPSSVNVSVSGGTNGQYSWYTGATGGTAITGQTNSTYATPALTATTTYYATITVATCESPRTPVVASIKTCDPPAIAATSSATNIGGKAQIDLTSVITDPNNDLDLSSLKITVQPASGAKATIVGQNLSIDYTGISFTGKDVLSIQICDQTGLCTTQQISIDVVGEVVVYNAVSPNGDNKNDFFLLENIELIPASQQNQVKIFNRWGDEVFSVSNYNNKDKVFAGLNKNGNKLPSGIYFYTVVFSSGKETLRGYLELR